MKKALKTIAMIGSGLVFVFWTHCAYEAGYKDCEDFMTNLKIHDDLVVENAKLKEELENKKI